MEAYRLAAESDEVDDMISEKKAEERRDASECRTLLHAMQLRRLEKMFREQRAMSAGWYS